MTSSGSGGSGFVCSAVQTGYENERGVEVAVKFIFKSRLAETDDASIKGEPVESFVLSRCVHPNIVAFHDLFEDREFWYLVSTAFTASLIQQVQELHGDHWAPGHTLEPGTQLHASASVPGIPVLDLNPPLLSPGSVYSTTPHHLTRAGGAQVPV